MVGNTMETKNFVVVSALLALLIVAAAVRPALAQTAGSNSDATAMVVLVNLERIRTQVNLAENLLQSGDRDGAFSHAFISHTTVFPSVKAQLSALDAGSTGKLESALTDYAFQIKDGTLSAEQAKGQASQIGVLLDSLAAKTGRASDEDAVSQVSAFLLRDAVQSYRQQDYQSAGGLVDAAYAKYQLVSGSMEESRQQEIESFFSDMKSAMAQKADVDSVAKLQAAIERDLAENLSESEGSGGYAQYFTTIRDLLAKVVSGVQAGNYKQAEQDGITAYLDNFEFLEAPIEKHDAKLMTTIEQQMRVQLREKIQAREAPSAIQDHVNAILANLQTAEGLLKNDPGYSAQAAGSGSSFVSIDELSQGFGAYKGPIKERGDAADTAKEEVRQNIDKIRVKLDETLKIYRDGDAQGAIQASRSAYLDSYENIEIPLRPINPDFTLEMEIKFAELRNQMQAGAPYEQVAAKVVEIRKGLDESERLVTGTGSLAPAIAFSTSFSIIFREGLESALIVGAILTYLEASRNERFKKHVYYGIVLAFAGTAATWFAAQFLIEISGANASIIEAVAGISAVAVLFWVSFWILNKVETKKWIEFVKAKVWKATTTGSVMVFVMLSFFTVYREGFETVLFYQAMLSYAKYMEFYVAAGLAIGLGIIIGVTFLVRKLGKKLPLRVLFGLTMGVGAYMSIAFMGNAIREFQEIGLIETTHLIGTIPRLDINLAAMTGIHPTLETVVAQVALLAVYLAGSIYVLWLQPRRKKAIESARKSRADLDRPATGSKRADIDIEDH
ncbi:high-affinity Fe2+/Pb2+ permease [Candidatus Nitrososphaera evergladensis SR1]|uniref:High-affinity Fe2+/Pb2+ permease n=1 Tax=Candidatus Nitrososphaera evergladensis SR1 TaxID=1459636 RepID=A0A075MZW8_9ARCH|nr:FTR1 family protein [Candidatus Nitrososphaera evergladensis]AIF84784.1 high-affinity Fe2+/Pb2+ permease [Candidatus Nitrososphaera evergladensis SR1]